MSESNRNQGLNERLSTAYHRMLERVKGAVEQTEKGTGPRLHNAVDKAKHTATELGELTREEAEKVASFLRRDLHDAARFVADSGKELRDWLQFDFELVEDSLADLFSSAVDQTRVELGQWGEQATIAGEWHSGEITGIGTLQCKNCGEVLHFRKVGHIPPCPKCHGSRFRRLTRSD
jgi:hypothetical protein